MFCIIEITIAKIQDLISVSDAALFPELLRNYYLLNQQVISFKHRTVLSDNICSSVNEHYQTYKTSLSNRVS